MIMNRVIQFTSLIEVRTSEVSKWNSKYNGENDYVP